MGIYISDLQVFKSEQGDNEFLGAIMASDRGAKELARFGRKLYGLKEKEGESLTPVSVAAYFVPSDIMPFYVITTKCRRLALAIGATSMNMSMLVNKCSHGNFEEAWSEIHPFCP